MHHNRYFKIFYELEYRLVTLSGSFTKFNCDTLTNFKFLDHTSANFIQKLVVELRTCWLNFHHIINIRIV